MPGPLRNDPALPEHDQHGNAADVVAGGQIPLSFGIDLEKSNLRFNLCGNALEGRSHDLAGPAPIGPEVHDHRNVVALNLDGKALGGHRERLAAEQRLMTAAAFRFRSRRVGRDAIDGIAMRTNDISCLVTHDFVPELKRGQPFSWSPLVMKQH